MKQVALKGDKYEIWEDTYSDPEKMGDVDKVGSPSDAPDTGEEFVFCNGKVVVFTGYVFSKLKKETYHREKEYDEEGQEIGIKEDKVSESVVDVKAVDGSNFVFVDGAPISCKEGGVSASGENWAVVDGVLQQVGTTQASGQFTECSSHVYVES
jgi:hypothetical protein